MALATWWTGDPISELSPLTEITVDPSRDVSTLDGRIALADAEITARLLAGNLAYVATIGGVAAACRWVATLAALIGEVGLDFAIPRTDHYLWDFVTLPAFRGKGIYPRLLRAIVASEGGHAQRFWIIYAPENAASGWGIAKAGFRQVSELAFQPDLSPGSAGIEYGERARVGALVLVVSLLRTVGERRVVSPCWRCSMTGAYHETGSPACWPRHGEEVACSCFVPPVVA